MTPKKYQYALLKYRPSILLGEQANVGFLLLLPDEGRIAFFYPTALSRLKHLFPEIRLPFIRSYLQTFEQTAKRLSKSNEWTALDPEKLLSIHFIGRDSSSLIFGDWRFGFYTSSEELINEFKDRYFSVYHEKSGKAPKHDETYLNKFFSRKLETHRTINQLIRRDVPLQAQHIKVQFDYAWQNGHVNLVRVLGFDLLNEQAILEKSQLWYGKLNLLEQELYIKGVEVHFLVSQPHAKSLQDAYRSAIDVLERLKGPKRIIEEGEVDRYLVELTREIQPMERGGWLG